MKRLVTTLAVVAGMGVLFGGTVSAGLYPVAPPGTFVELESSSFIQFVPLQSPGLPDPNPVIGDNLGQHPGAFGVGLPPVGSFFIGVFGGLINTSKPDAAIYLWETSAPPNGVAFTGPQIQLGYWDGTSFSPFGIPQAASYVGTGAPETDPPFLREINSSMTLLSDFGVSPGASVLLNAVRIEATDMFAHNQVTAVATNVVPEPSSILVFGTGLVGLLIYGRRRRKQMREPSRLDSH